jgi:hypothetical protein
MVVRCTGSPVGSLGEAVSSAPAEGITRPVTHAHTAADMARAGRDVEKIVLARALTLLLEERVFLSGDRAVVFE